MRFNGREILKLKRGDVMTYTLDDEGDLSRIRVRIFHYRHHRDFKFITSYDKETKTLTIKAV